MSGFRVAGDKSSHRKKERKHPKLRLAMKIALLVILLIIMAVMIVFYVKFGDDLLRWRNQAKQDDAMIVEYGSDTKVKLIEGSYENIKVTTPEDMGIAELFLKKRRKM